MVNGGVLEQHCDVVVHRLVALLRHDALLEARNRIFPAFLGVWFGITAAMLSLA
jgi:hypothetical protein